MILMDFLFGDKRLFRKVYWGVMDSIDAPKSAKKKLLPCFEKAYFDGEATRSCVKQAKIELPDGTWNWPAYEAQAETLEYGMHETLVNRVWRLASALSQYRRALQSRDTFPLLQLDVPDQQKARPECVARDGMVMHFDDDYWKDGFPPCERLDCLCRTIRMTEKMAKRRGLNVDSGAK